MRVVIFAGLWASLCMLNAGCLLGMGGHETRVNENQRLLIKFSSIQASHDFHEALEKSDRSKYISGGGFIFLPFGGGGGDVFYETAHYNAQVRKADVDRNGDITEEEASAYLDWIEKRARERED